ncbi:hypothetical protein ACFOED_14590 [Vulcaniibacterium thermophilum]
MKEEPDRFVLYADLPGVDIEVSMELGAAAETERRAAAEPE